jgi:hypothetical protein
LQTLRVTVHHLKTALDSVERSKKASRHFAREAFFVCLSTLHVRSLFLLGSRDQACASFRAASGDGYRFTFLA